MQHKPIKTVEIIEVADGHAIIQLNFEDGSHVPFQISSPLMDEQPQPKQYFPPQPAATVPTSAPQVPQDARSQQGSTGGASDKQKGLIKYLMSQKGLDASWLKANSVDNINTISMKQASALITKLKA